MDILIGSIASISAVGGFVISRFIRIRKAKREIEDVLVLVHKLIDKYSDVDDDALQLKKEAWEAANAVKKVFGI